MNTKVNIERPEPKSIYKYMTCDSAFSVLTTKTLRWSNPSKFNDPFEADFHPYFQKELYKFSKNFNQEEFERNKKSLAYICFSAQKDNGLMWAHYADSYSGVMLEFETDMLKKDFLKKDHPKDVYFKSVEYFSVYPQPETVPPWQKGGVLHRHANKKHEKWAYEEEWRFIGQRDLQNSEHAFIDKSFSTLALKRIWVGPKIKKDEWAKLLSFLNNSQGYEHLLIWKTTGSIERQKLIQTELFSYDTEEEKFKHHPDNLKLSIEEREAFVIDRCQQSDQ